MAPSIPEKHTGLQRMTTEAEVYEALALRVVATHGGARCFYNAAGQLHRSTGPAVEWPNGDQVWVHKGLRHRIDGPAVVSADGYKEWWINGVEYTKNEYHLQLKLQGHTS